MLENEAVALSNITMHVPVSSNALLDTSAGQVRSGAFIALDNVSFSIKSGTCTLICGANGSGKSVLMSIIAGLETPTGGSVKTSSTVGLVFQEPDSQILGETPREDIAFGPQNMGFSKEKISARVAAALEQSGLSDRADYPSRTLSGGEKRRLAVAGILAMNAEIIIFDEPFANMDYMGVVQVNALIKELMGGGKTVIILTHEIEKCMALAERFIVLYKGKKVFDGSTEEALLADIENWGIHHPLKNPVRELKDLLWR
jgi:biotin transport system ATP-binding protein